MPSVRVVPAFDEIEDGHPGPQKLEKREIWFFY
jgi:hypothetical protein